MSEASVINASCQLPVPACGSAYNICDSFADLAEPLDEWKQWQPSDLADVGDIEILPATNFTSAVVTLHYRLNGKDGKLFAWMRPYGKSAPGPTFVTDFNHTNKVVIVVPGSDASGVSEGYAMLQNASSYENVVYSVACATGDALVYQYPGQDMRSLVGTNSPTAMRMLPDAINNRLIACGTSLATVVQIELAAIMKFLRGAHGVTANLPNYTKIGVMGLSKGAWPALMGAIYSEPTACVMASGVSLKEYRSLGFGSIGGNMIPNVEDLWPQEDIVDAVTNSTCKFYYPHSTSGNELPFMLEEADNETATALAGANFTDNKHTQGHCYPSGTLAWLQAALA